VGRKKKRKSATDDIARKSVRNSDASATAAAAEATLDEVRKEEEKSTAYDAMYG